MQMTEGLDEGPVYCARKIAIYEDETAGALSDRLAVLAAEVVREDLPRALRGELVAVPQDDALASFAPPLRREEGRLDWTRTARELVNQVRGLAPRPGAFTTCAGKSLRVLSGAVTAAFDAPPGSVRVERGRVFVATAEGAFELLEAQPEGRALQSARDLVNGRVLVDGARLGVEG
jgi:methionyl-tRNA formyltransferase